MEELEITAAKKRYNILKQTLASIDLLLLIYIGSKTAFCLLNLFIHYQSYNTQEHNFSIIISCVFTCN